MHWGVDISSYRFTNSAIVIFGLLPRRKQKFFKSIKFCRTLRISTIKWGWKYDLKKRNFGKRFRLLQCNKYYFTQNEHFEKKKKKKKADLSTMTETYVKNRNLVPMYRIDWISRPLKNKNKLSINQSNNLSQQMIS